MNLGVEKATSTSQPATALPAARPWSVTINHWFSKHWLLVFNSAWGFFVILPWLAPLFLAGGLTFPGRVIYFIYNFFCHQLPERSWFLFGPQLSYTQAEIALAWGKTLPAISNELVRRQFIGTPELGWKVAWSDRMVSMYMSIFIFGVIYAILRERGVRFPVMPWWILGLFILPMALDGTTHLITDVLRLDFRQTNEWAAVLTGHAFPTDFYAGDAFSSLNSVLRLITGILFGFGIVGFLWPLMEREFSPMRDADYGATRHA